MFVSRFETPSVERLSHSTSLGNEPDSNGDRAGAVGYAVLGPLQLWVGKNEITPTAPKVLQVLALLLLRANRTVTSEALILELWGDEPPRSALTTLQTYIYHLRKLLEHAGVARVESDVLVTRAPGYVLRVQSSQLDLRLFEKKLLDGRIHFAQLRSADAAVELRAALRLWTEAPLSNVRLGPLLSAYVTDMQEMRRTAIQFAIEADMDLGDHREIVGELFSLIADYPLDEWFHQQLMVALDRCGRRGDALRIYQGLRGVLSDELGIDPSAESQELHRQLLA